MLKNGVQKGYIKVEQYQMVIFFLENEVLEFRGERERAREREREREAGLNIVLKHMENTNEEK